MNKKVVILAAGIGSRINDIIGYSHKALISIGEKAAINHIIDKFDYNHDFIIAVGFEKDLIKQYLKLAYPDRNITFVDIDKFIGKGSGPGYSLLKCKEAIGDNPFLLTTCDTIVERYPISNENWIGVYEDRFNNPEKWCTVSSKNEKVIDIYEKSSHGTSTIYIGVMYIKDYLLFWQGLEKNTKEAAGELQVSNGWKSIMEKSDLYIKNFDTWYDTGSKDSLERTRKAFGKPRQLEKPDENLYFVNDLVIKYFKNKQMVKDRIIRASLMKDAIPEIIDHTDNFYCYKYVKGEVMSEVVNDQMMLDFLHFCEKNIWQGYTNMSMKEYEMFTNHCYSFYKQKTYDRVKKFLDSGIVSDIPETVNGYNTPCITDLLKMIDFGNLAQGVPVIGHGDLHFENIIVKDNGNGFSMLDWRQEFCSNNYHYFDIYYDYAKILHGMYVHHGQVQKNNFSFSSFRGNIKTNILIPYNINSAREVFLEYLVDKKVDVHKVNIITALIFLNIAPLHHYPYNLFLYYLGKYRLTKLLQK
jgi:NDP-sugar pyrophosphorylase family protein